MERRQPLEARGARRLGRGGLAAQSAGHHNVSLSSFYLYERMLAVAFLFSMMQMLNIGASCMAMADWRAQQIQFVWFLAEVDGLSAGDIFRQIWSTEPEQIQQNRAPNPSNPFLSVASIIEGGRTSQVQVQPGRVDVIYSADPLQEDQAAFHSLFDLVPNLTKMLQGVELNKIVVRDAFRLAAVVTVLKPVSTYEHGVGEFIEALGFDFAVPNATDLVFQVNSRKSLGDVNVNRLIQLGTIGIHSGNFTLMPGARIPMPDASTTQYAARRHFDFNTVPDGRLLEHASHGPILRSLADEITRVIEAGAVRGLRS
ncbi:hypothetical protein NKJ59_02635 [Mesorhizobium australicum]|uniref:hypothetical protein n=1 Tax=Mesorhizobium australicum TaxID=536018 RepID=UPI003335BAA7